MQSQHLPDVFIVYFYISFSYCGIAKNFRLGNIIDQLWTAKIPIGNLLYYQIMRLVFKLSIFILPLFVFIDIICSFDNIEEKSVTLRFFLQIKENGTLDVCITLS